jgi:hypothetical protein
MTGSGAAAEAPQYVGAGLKLGAIHLKRKVGGSTSPLTTTFSRC